MIFKLLVVANLAPKTGYNLRKEKKIKEKPNPSKPSTLGAPTLS